MKARKMIIATVLLFGSIVIADTLMPQTETASLKGKCNPGNKLYKTCKKVGAK